MEEKRRKARRMEEDEKEEGIEARGRRGRMMGGMKRRKDMLWYCV